MIERAVLGAPQSSAAIKPFQRTDQVERVLSVVAGYVGLTAAIAGTAFFLF